MFRPALPIILALSLAGCGTSPQARFARASEAYARHDYAAAKLDLAEVVTAQPANVDAQMLLVRTCIALGDAERARSALAIVAKSGKAPADLPLLQGQVELLSGRPERALAAVQGMTVADAWRIRALAHLDMEDPGRAEQAFAQGAVANGERGPLLADYAHFKLAHGELADARRLADLAARAKPRPLASYLASADVLAAQSALGKALQTFDAALAAYPQSRSALLGKIRTLDALDRNDESLALIADALSADANDPTLIYLDARQDALRGQWDRVRDKLQAREALLNDEPQANRLYAKALLELGQKEQARNRLSAQLLRSPADRATRLLLGQAQLIGGDPAAAVATLRPFSVIPDATGQELGLLAQAMTASGDPVGEAMGQRARGAAGNRLVSQLATADRALRARDWPTAISAYEKILAQTDGNNVLVLNNLAFAYDQSGDQRRALQFAERALKLAPDQASVMDTAGWLLHRSGKDKPRARALLREAARKAPGNATIAAHLTQAS